MSTNRPSVQLVESETDQILPAKIRDRLLVKQTDKVKFKGVCLFATEYKKERAKEKTMSP